MKKILSLILALLMFVSAIPMTVFANGSVSSNDNATEPVVNDVSKQSDNDDAKITEASSETVKQEIQEQSSELPPQAYEVREQGSSVSGSCGINLTWELDLDDGILTVSGSGAMYNYNHAGFYRINGVLYQYTDAPWSHDYSEYIKTVIISDGVTKIGARAFSYCSSLSTVTVGKSVIVIAEYAFSSCNNLKIVNNKSPIKLTIGDTYNGYIAYYADYVNIKYDIIERYNDFIFGYDNDENWYLVKYTGNSSSLTLPEDYKGEAYYIDEKAFQSKLYLNSVTFTEGVIGMGNYVFNGCTSLASVYLTDNIIDIPDYAFKNCTSLSSVNLSENVVSIGNSAFYGCSMLASVNLSENVVSIGDSAFYGCSVLASITIPSGVENIGEYAFANCKKLSSVIIPDGVKSVSSYAFYNCTSLNSVTIGNGVSCVGSYAFSGCKVLKSVTFSNSLKEISDYAFSGCTALTTATLPESVTTLGCSCFRDCTNLISVSLGSCINIGDHAFSNCSSIYSVVIPDTTIRIESSAFSHCSSICSVIIGQKVKAIGSSAFYECKKIESIVLPDTLTDIGEWAFSNCAALTEITFGSGISNIENNVFHGCALLKKVNIYDVNSWMSVNFVDYESNPLYFAHNLYCNGQLLTDIQPTEGITVIRKLTFIGMTSLKSVTVPESVSSIEDDAFIDCTSLEKISVKSVESWAQISFASKTANPLSNGGQLYKEGELVKEIVLNDVESVSDYAFSSCSSIETVVFSNNVNSIGIEAFSDCCNLQSVTFGENVSVIGQSSFSRCNNIVSITFPDSVTEIGSSSFSNCSNLKYITIGKGVKSIGSSSFRGTAVESVVIPNNVEHIFSSAFSECKSINSITLPFVGSDENSNCYLGYLFGAATYSDNGKYVPSSLKKVTISEGCESLADNIFNGCANITDISIPNSISSIGKDAFAGCTSLNYYLENNAYYLGNADNHYVCLVKALDSSITSFYMPEKTKIISDSAFENFTSLKMVSLGNEITSIGNFAFNGCSTLFSVNIPDSVLFIGDSAFKCCYYLHTVNLGQCETIGDHAFSTCHSINELIIPDTVKTIKASAFSHCTAVSKITMGNNVEYIGYCAFFQCLGIKEFVIPDSVTYVGEGAFRLSSALTTISIGKNVKTIGPLAFDVCTALTTVYYSADQETWNSIDIGTKNTCLLSANITYNAHIHNYTTVSKTQPSVYENGHVYKKCETCGNEIIEDRYLIGYCYNASEWIFDADTKTLLILGYGAIGKFDFPDISKVAKVKVDAGITTIYSNTFNDFTNLCSVYFGKNVTSIMEGAFDGCEIFEVLNDSELNITEGSSDFGGVALYANIVSKGDDSVVCNNGDFIVAVYNENGTLLRYCADDAVVEFPSTVEYNGEELNITEIYNDALFYNTKITKLIIPDGYNYIGGNAFLGCSNLVDVVLSKDLTEIGDSAFCDCNSIKNVHFNGTEQEWENVYVSDNNECLLDANFTFAGHIHNLEDWITTKKPTCTQKGLKTQKCTICKQVINSEEIDALDHAPGTWEVTVTAKCTVKGEKVQKCTRCKIVLNTEVINPTGHINGKWEITVAVKCFENGEKIQKCTVCKEILKTEVIVSKGHTPGDWEITKKVTCFEDGERVQKCSLCKTVLQTEVVATTGHSIGDWVYSDEKGVTYRAKKCANCDYEEKQLYLDFSVINYLISIKSDLSLATIRYALGEYTTASEIKNAKGCVTLSETIIKANTVNDEFTRTISTPGVYSFYLKYKDGSEKIVVKDITYFTQELSANDTNLKVSNLYGVASLTFSYGQCTSYSQVKDAKVLRVTNAKFSNYKNYSYLMPHAGDVTVYVTYDDTQRAPEYYYITLSAPEPTITQDGLNITVDDLDNVKCIKRAFGRYSTLTQVKAASGVITYGSDVAHGEESVILHIPHEGELTVAIQYKSGYTVIKNITIEQKRPSFVQEGNKVTIGNLDDLYIVRYAKGIFTKPNAIKSAKGSKCLRADAIVNGYITVDNLENGTYTFLVQYNDESQNIYTITVG